MTDVIVDDAYIRANSTAIRSRNGSSNQYSIAQQAAAIAALPGPSTLVTKSITANGSYDPASDSADGYSAVTVNVPDPRITADYAALSYGYVGANGNFAAYTNKINFINLYELTAGTYVFFVGQTVSNRLRACFFNGKTLSDFETYLENAASSQTIIYTADVNITGTTEITDDGLIQRVFFTTANAGALLIGTSSQSVTAPTMLVRIS